MQTLIRVTVAVACAVVTSVAGAQQPVPVVPPLSGKVVSVDGLPVAEAEVTAEGVRESVRTDAQGLFSIAKVSKGIHTLNIRRLGYLPAVVSVVVPVAVDSLTVTLVPSRHELDTVKVSARVNVLAGIVVDEHNKPLAGASVALNTGALGTVVTGDDGWFNFTAVRSGPTILNVVRPGYEGTMQSVLLQDWRGIVVHMTPIDMKLSKTRQQIISGQGGTARHVWLETEDRLVRRSLRSVVVTRDELAPLDDLPLGQAITHAPSATNLLPDMDASHNSACVLLDGYQVIGQTSLDSYNTEDVEFVELYPPEAGAPRSVMNYMRSAGCSMVRTDQLSRGVFYAVVWLRN